MSATTGPRTAIAAPVAAAPQARSAPAVIMPVRRPRRIHTEAASHGRTPASRAEPNAVAATMSGTACSSAVTRSTSKGPVVERAAAPATSPV
ncbi:hypothetical protein O2L01_03805 [Glycomyces lechevalierae]|uniref:Uncharacterized protein n=1 Tax=Glycomyces lechevalierae TaxID=256034 RepID=A0A9X3PFN7_9ACTN|nr:hypothetical protein [Glycomyces lechevalierae]MDA1384102.1 hypothetical protein [Glycomyces lechevalierae]MDR7339469.1 hypothetical protein [Glycomyces lechevalierae]